MSAEAVAVPEADVSDKDVRRDWLLLAGATVAFGIGFGINNGAAPAFMGDYLHIPPFGLGLLESLREVPGLLTAAIIGIVSAFAEPVLAMVALGVLGLGVAAVGQTHSFWPLVLCNVVWSIGLHTWMTVQPSLTLTLSRRGHHGFGLGVMNSYTAVATMAGLAFVWLFTQALGYGWSFGVAGATIALGGLFVARIPASRGGGLTRRLVFRPRYWRYYGLMLLDGGRRQIVQMFAVLILVIEYHVGAGHIALLLLVNSALTMAASPAVGRWTDRFGERKVLTVYYGLVAVVFFAYTRIGHVAAATGAPAALLFAGVFTLDNLLFTGSVGIQTYIRHTAPRDELSPSLAMGLTWNHVAAVTAPLAAGWIWKHFGYERIFLYGIGLALASLTMCLTLPKHVAAHSE